MVYSYLSDSDYLTISKTYCITQCVHC